MSAQSTSQTCRVYSCVNTALYTCPRCRLPYCSVPCYRAHSQRCVDAFAEDAMQPLRGLTTSPAHRRSFNNMLERIRDETDAPCTEHNDFFDTDSGDESDDVCENANVQTSQHTDTKPPSDHSGELHVLEQLLNSLDEPGRQALFTVLNSAMENTCGQGTFPQLPPHQITYPRNSKSRAKPPDTFNTINHTQGVTDTLEMLVEEMETMNLSYHEILSRLPDFLRNDFEKRLREGSVDRLVPAWFPWWQHMKHPPKSNSEEVQPPGPLPPLPSSSQLLVPLHVPRQKASLCLRYSLIDVLAAHAFSMRLCNGEWWGDAFAARSVWRISTVLSRDARYKSVGQVCDAVKQNIVQEENHSLAMQVLRDVADILSGRSDWVSRALHECQCVLESGLKVAGSANGEVRKGVRKIGFFVSWSMCQESEVFEEIARKVVLFVELESGLAEEVKVATRVVEARQKPKISVLE